MSTQDIKEKYYQLGVVDARYKQYPLFATLVIAQEQIAAAAYQSGWRDETGMNLRFFRDGQKR